MAKFAKKFHETLNNAIADESRGAELKSMAYAAGEAGIGSEAWIELTKQFSDDPRELAQMKRPRKSAKFNTNICTIFATGHGVETQFLRTLTTLSLACKPHQGGATQKRATKSRTAKKSVGRK